MRKLLSKQLMRNKMQQKRPKLGPLEIQLFAYTQLRKQDVIRTGEMGTILGINSKQERELLSRMARSGLIIRLKRGMYLVPSRVPPGGRWAVSEYFILSKLMKAYDGKYQISGPNAFNFYGYDNQIPNRIYVYNNKLVGDKNVGGTEFVFMKTSDKRLGSTNILKIATGLKTIMVSRARALMDAVYDWSRYNTIPRAYNWITQSLKKDPKFATELIKVTSRYGNTATIRRIGYLLTTCGVAKDELTILNKKAGSPKSFIAFIPGRDRKGSINKEWRLIINNASSK